MKRILWISLLVTNACMAAGPLSFGIRAGLPLTDFIDNVNSGNFIVTSSTHRYAFGPSLELHLPAGLGLEVDALYRRINFNTNAGLASLLLTPNQTSGNAWEFPLLAKYRLSTPLIKPYVDAGLAFDTLSGLKQTVVSAALPGTQPTTINNPSELTHSTTTGFVIGFGADIHALVLHISPEIRYTRWGSSHFTLSNGSPISNQNQAEFLVGFTF